MLKEIAKVAAGVAVFMIVKNMLPDAIKAKLS